MILQPPQTGSPAISKSPYRYVKYTFFKLDAQWSHLPPEACESSKTDFLNKLKRHEREFSIRTYSLRGTRADVDFATWLITDSVYPLTKKREWYGLPFE